MVEVYYAVASQENENFKTGFHIAKEIIKDKDKLDGFHLEEVTLVNTGWAENSIRLAAFSQDKQRLKLFTIDVQKKFDEILKEAYAVEVVSKIEFDDDTLNTEIKLLNQTLKESSIEFDERPSCNLVKI